MGLGSSELLRGLLTSVETWADGQCLAVAKTIRGQLQDMPPSGLFDRVDLRSVWDEYCLQVQYGPASLEHAWAATIDPLVNRQVDELPRREASLLTLWQRWVTDDLSEDVDPTCYNSDMIRAAVVRRLDQLAAEPALDWVTG